MVPHSFSTMTASSMRIGWVIASCTPANKLLSTGRAARPTTMPATRAEANKLTPYCRTGSKVISGADRDDHHHHVAGAQQHAHLGDVLARQQVIVDVEPELPQIKIGGDGQRGDRRPADQSDHGN